MTNATPTDSSDGFNGTLTGLSDQDGDGQADDLGAGAIVAGQSADRAFATGGTFVNVANTTGDDTTVTDTATVVVTEVLGAVQTRPSAQMLAATTGSLPCTGSDLVRLLGSASCLSVAASYCPPSPAVPAATTRRRHYCACSPWP